MGNCLESQHSEDGSDVPSNIHTFKNNNNNSAASTTAAAATTNSTSTSRHQQQVQQRPIPVYLNVYNLQQLERGKKKSFNQSLGFGIYHSGVEVLGVEIAFGGVSPGTSMPADHPGIFATPPKMIMPSEQFHQQIHCGNVYGLTIEGVREVVHSMHKEYLASAYHLLSKNCNHFAAALLEEISKKFNVVPMMQQPSWINRAANWGDTLLPDKVYKYYLSQTPQAPGASPDESESDASPTTTTKTTTATSSSSTERPIYIPGLDPPPHVHHHHRRNNNNETDSARQQQYYYFQQQQQQQRQQREQARREMQQEEEDILSMLPIPTREEMKIMHVREIKTVMWVHGIDWTGCLEKTDLMDRVDAFEKQSSGQSAQSDYVGARGVNAMNARAAGAMFTPSENSPNNHNNKNNNNANNNANNSNSNSNNATPPRQQQHQQRSEVELPVDEAAVQRIQSMGFTERSKIIIALKKFYNHSDRAVEWLLENSP